ncbi:glycosyltransferase family 4 protein [Heliorestis acidaminivorans]|uniref:Glycosyltransferase family 4 protein n=1 Tax=Heliorestis acidaminivorans TaxID=553427 RepID=A0A6I0EZ20_9FIRM|nr:glycosyltransferase family 4 protein [Heliorestis acidaminivorans]KAB2953756.1 glycosyltransferase family 4 protein [Heliorestis acidaminivorans]
MHILYIHQYFNTPERGGGTRSYEFARRLVQKGHKVTMITGMRSFDSNSPQGKSTTKDIDGIQVIYLDTDYSNYMSHGGRMKSFLRFAREALIAGKKVEDFELVFATSTPLTVALPGIRLAKLHNVPLVFEVRDLWPEVPIQVGAIKNPFMIKMLKWFEQYTYNYAKHVVALSPGMSQGVIDTGISKEKVTMIPNCCDLKIFDPQKDLQDRLKKYQLPDTAIVAYCGAISDANAPDLMIEAAEILQKKKVPVTLVLAGEGRQKPKLEEMTRGKNLKNVLFLGHVSKQDVAALYHRAISSLVLFKGLPILSTNSPNKFFDALSAGTPVITNMGGWVGNLVEKNKIGYSVEKENPQALADAIESIVNLDVENRKAMGNNARKLAESQFSRDDMADKLEKIFQKVVNENK